ncbi:MAG TPA: hypothetical protein VJR93_09600, partial [Chthoniobacterales bacterium]|nr:hypothetical protein [Chthoniobacterales bacterium]
MPLIQAAINNQARELTKGTLVPTNLVIGRGTTMVLASNDQLSKTIGALNGLAGNHNGVPVSAVVTSPAANNVVGSSPVVSVSSSAQLVSLLGNTAPGSGGAINVTPGTVNVGGNVAVSANTAGVSVKA